MSKYNDYVYRMDSEYTEGFSARTQDLRNTVREVVTKTHEGMTVPDICEEMNIQPACVYRYLRKVRELEV